MCLTSYPTSAPILIPLEDAFFGSLCRVQASFPERERAERFPYASIPNSIISLTDGWRRCSGHRLTVCKRPHAQGAFLSVLSPSFGASGFPSGTMIPQGVRLQEPVAAAGTPLSQHSIAGAAVPRFQGPVPAVGKRRERTRIWFLLRTLQPLPLLSLPSQVRTVKKLISSGRIHSVPENNQTQAKGRQTREPLHGLPKSAFLLRDQEGNTLKDYPEPGRGNSRREPCCHPPRGPPGTGSDTIRKQPEKDSRTTDVIQEKTPSMTSKWEVNFCLKILLNY